MEFSKRQKALKARARELAIESGMDFDKIANKCPSISSGHYLSRLLSPKKTGRTLTRPLIEEISKATNIDLFEFTIGIPDSDEAYQVDSWEIEDESETTFPKRQIELRKMTGYLIREAGFGNKLESIVEHCALIESVEHLKVLLTTPPSGKLLTRPIVQQIALAIDYPIELFFEEIDPAPKNNPYRGVRDLKVAEENDKYESKK